MFSNTLFIHFGGRPAAPTYLGKVLQTAGLGRGGTIVNLLIGTFREALDGFYEFTTGVERFQERKAAFRSRGFYDSR